MLMKNSDAIRPATMNSIRRPSRPGWTMMTRRRSRRHGDRTCRAVWASASWYPTGISELEAIVRYGEYLRVEQDEGYSGPQQWQRVPREEIVTVNIGKKATGNGTLPSRTVVVLSLSGRSEVCRTRTWTAVFPRELEVFRFSSSIAARHRRTKSATKVSSSRSNWRLHSDSSFIARPNLRSLESDDWDERVADLQYRDSYEFSVGHSVSTESIVEDGQCKTVRTCWLPTAEVEKVAPSKIPGVTLEMEALRFCEMARTPRSSLGFVTTYKDWIKKQVDSLDELSAHRKETAQELLHRAQLAADRIQAGIDLLGDPQCLEAFRIANKAMAAQGRRRLALQWNKPPRRSHPPGGHSSWRSS